MKYFQECLNTIKAGWLELTLARLFGRLHIVRDEFDTQITMVKWRDKTYLLDAKEGNDPCL